MTIWEVLLRSRTVERQNGILRGSSYITCTFTKFPGALQVPRVQTDHVVGLVALALSQFVETVLCVRLDDLTNMLSANTPDAVTPPPLSCSDTFAPGACAAVSFCAASPDAQVRTYR